MLAHHFEDSVEKPIIYAYHSLAPAERRYLQLDKEGLAIIIAVERFHHYIYGRQFTIQSDHKPLQHIFGETQPVQKQWHLQDYRDGLLHLVNTTTKLFTNLDWIEVDWTRRWIESSSIACYTTQSTFTRRNHFHNGKPSVDTSEYQADQDMD